ncbi:MAG TPA: glycosyltransferase family 9 protein [Trueperaceae bacterium]
MPLSPGVERIAVLRSNGIGDLVFALPALAALRSAYPRARITLLGRSWHEELLAGRPGPVDEVVTVPPWRGVGDDREDPDAVEAFFEAMREREFDLALQLHGGGANSNPFVSRLGARLTVGMRAPGAPALDLTFPYIYYQQEVMRLLEVVSLVGATPVELEPRIAVTERDREEARAFLSRMGGTAEDAPIAALNAGAGDTRRRWPTEKFAQVGDALMREGCRVVVTGSSADRPLAAAIEGSMRSTPLIAAGELSLGGVLGLFERSRVVVSNDSGPLHLAAAVAAPTVGIFWCGNLINAGPLFRSRRRPQISWRLDCPVCGVDCTRGSCEHGESFVADVAVDEVTEAAIDLFHSARAGSEGPTSPQALSPLGEPEQQGRGGGQEG